MESNKNFYEDVCKLCSEYIGGAWNSVAPGNIRIKTLAGGMSNEVFLCSLPSSMKNMIGKEPRHVLLRLYGSHLRDDPNRLTRDAGSYVVTDLIAQV